MIHYSSMTVAALAAGLLMSISTLQVTASDAQTTETAETTVSAALADEAVTVSEPDTTEGVWQTIGGKHYYVFPDGSKAVGEIRIDGIPYLFGFSGALKTDWQTVEGNRYYYDPASGEAVYGWIDYFDHHYYVTEESGKLTGMQEIDGSRYLFSEDGALLTAEFYIEDVRYYANPVSGMLQEDVYSVGADTILTNAEGEVVTGWYTLSDGRCFYSDPESGLAESGLICVDGIYYYIDSENGLEKGVLLLEDGIYPFDAETGALTSGIYVYDGAQYYFDLEALGNVSERFVESDGNIYYFDASGVMQTAWAIIGEDTYYFGDTGVMCTGFLEADGSTFCFGEDGKMCYGWQTIGEAEYYFGTDGIMAVSETILLDNMNCTFDEYGVLIGKDASVVLDVIHYRQQDDRWGSVRLGTSSASTIAKVGCLDTSLAMLQTYYTMEEVTPVDMKGMLAFTSGGALANWSYVTDLGYTVENLSGKITSDLMLRIHVMLQAGCPVILGSKQSSGGQHYVVITGYTGDGITYQASDFLINDPGYSRRFVLSDHLAQYGTLYKLIY